MGTQQNKVALKSAYISFAEGRPQPFLDLLAPEADILYFGPPDKVPWAGSYQGPQGYEELVARIREHMEIQEFKVEEIIAEGDQIMVLGLGRGVSKRTRAPFEYDWAHYIRFQGARIMEFRVYIDTAAIVVTLQQ
jgi:ketosteroid isomerase-like protein